MRCKNLLVIFILLLFVKLDAFSQKKTYFSPELWLQSHHKVHDSAKVFDKLNFNSRLHINKKNLWTSDQTINNSNHLFVVYKANKDENLLALIGNEKSLFIDGKKVKLTDSVSLDGYNEPFGELLDIRFSGIEDGKFWINYNFEESNLFEVILMKGILPAVRLNEIRTYLSVKYGIDLIDPKQYSYESEEWWKGTDKRFNYNIFGLARLDVFNLNNHISTHSKDQDLIVMRSLSTNNAFNEGDYILFGNNKKSLTFNKKTKLSHKQWIAKTNRTKTIVDVAVPVKALSQTSDYFHEYELILHDNNFKQTYNAQIKDSLLIFKDVVFTASDNRILQLKEYKSDLKFNIENACDNFKLNITASKNLFNYSIKIIDDKGEVVYSSENLKDIYEVNNNNSSYFDIHIAYNGKKVSKRIKTETFNLKPKGLNKHYTLFNGPQKIQLKNDENLIIKWFKATQEIAQGANIVIDTEGDYHVEISNEKGCTVTENFTVSNDFNDQGWRVYPNPAAANEEVFVRFQLISESDVELALYANDGKLIRTFTPGKIHNETIKLGPLNLSSGVYIIVAYINNIPEIKKIIIK